MSSSNEQDPLLRQANELDRIIASLEPPSVWKERLVKPLTTLNVIGEGHSSRELDDPRTAAIERNRIRARLGDLHPESVPAATPVRRGILLRLRSNRG